jgi:hypothetical protein
MHFELPPDGEYRNDQSSRLSMNTPWPAMTVAGKAGSNDDRSKPMGRTYNHTASKLWRNRLR